MKQVVKFFDHPPGWSYQQIGRFSQEDDYLFGWYVFEEEMDTVSWWATDRLFFVYGVIGPFSWVAAIYLYRYKK